MIRGGRVVTPSGVGPWDVAVLGEKIVAVSAPGTLDVEGARVIDAKGKIVVPGGIEPHAHIGGPRQPERSGAEAVSRAAIYGGTTTVLDFATQVPGHDLRHALDEAAERWRGNAHTDYSYNPIFGLGAEPGHIAQVPELIQEGFPSFKVFTTSIRPPSPQMEDRKTDFGRLAAIMEQVATHGGVLMIHSEDDERVRYNYDMARERGLWDWWSMHLIHSNLSEDVSFRRAIRLAEHQRVAAYFVHVSAREGVAAIAEARGRGLPVYGETLHNYACFNAENYKEPDGMKYHTYPSLKSEEDRQGLWRGLHDGALSTLATDLVSTTWEVKTGYKTVADVTGGHNGIETTASRPGSASRTPRASTSRGCPSSASRRSPRRTPLGSSASIRERAPLPRAATPTSPSSTLPSAGDSRWTTCTWRTTASGRAGRCRAGRSLRYCGGR